MIFLKKTTLLLFLLLVYGCGYSPLLNSVENDFYIKNLTFKGDRQINNYISNMYIFFSVKILIQI